jgi:hypothetical protein
MELAHSYKEIERANTNLVGENTTLEEMICVKSSAPLHSFCFFDTTFLSSNSFSQFLLG